MLTYQRSDQLMVTGYLDSDFVGCLDSRRSTPGYIFILTGRAISWKSVKQTLVTSSNMEAEFVAFYEAFNQKIWLHNFITSLQVVVGIDRPILIYYDNELLNCIQRTIGVRQNLSTLT